MIEATRQFIDWHLQDGVGQLTLRRPPLNVIGLAMLRELQAALAAAAHETALKALVLRADPTLRVFSAGVDVADHTADKVGELIPLFDQVCAAVAEFPAPTLAVVHGHALGGGCELALCCDLVIAAEAANFGQPEIKLAALAPIAAIRLPELVSYRRTAEMLFLGEAVSATEAARLGLINRAVPDAELEATVSETLGRLRRLSGAALRLCKRGARLGAHGWAQLPALETLYLEELMPTEDAREGVASFLEKRAPAWTNR